MPSPVGHALGAALLGGMFARVGTARVRPALQLGAIAALGVAPDLDLLFWRHRYEWHSLGAAALVATAAAVVAWPVAAGRWRIWIVSFLAWSSHVLLDACGTDRNPPIGIEAWWPISTRFAHIGNLFPPVRRGLTSPGFVEGNLNALAAELFWLGIPLLVMAWWWWRRRIARSTS